MFQNLARGLLAATLAITGATHAQVAKSSAASALAASPLKVAFVYVSPIGDAGWTYQHDLARLAMERELGDRVKTTVVESVAEGPDAERVMRDLAAQGNRLIFATSFGYLEPALRVAADFPTVKFEHAGGYKSAPNLQTYNARFYEGRYLAGLVAGKSSKTGIAGYVAGFPVPEVIQGINAFTLGMREANPKAQVKVLWLNTWFDPAREREAALTLIHQGADVLANHSASPAVAQTAEEQGVMLTAYQSDMRRYAPHAQLTSVIHRWDTLTTRAARSVIDGTWTSTPVWGGLKDGFIELAPLSASVGAETRALVDAKRRAIVAGRFSPFSGRILDTDGKVRLAGGTMSDADIAAMNWFVRGVSGSLPRP